MKKNLLSKFKKSAVTMVVEGISEFDNEKVITKVLGSKSNKVDNKNYSNGNTSQDILVSTFGIERILKNSAGNVCFIK